MNRSDMSENFQKSWETGWRSDRIKINCSECSCMLEIMVYRLKYTTNFFCNRKCLAVWKSTNTRGENNNRFGVKLEQKTKDLISKSHIGLTHTESTKQTLREYRSKQVLPSKDSKPEKEIQRRLDKAGVSYLKHVKLPGQPDMFISPNTCIFVDGCFFHACKYCLKLRKIKPIHIDQQEVDRKITQKLKNMGYRVIRLSTHTFMR